MLVKYRSEKAYGRTSLIRVSSLVFVTVSDSLSLTLPRD